MLKHIGGFIVGVFVGILIIAVVLVGGGYFLLTKEGTMKKVEEGVGGSLGMDLDEEKEQYSLLEYGKSIIAIYGELSNTPLAEIEATIGIKKITETISDAIGIDEATLGESTLTNLGKTITENLNVSLMSEKFEMALPDLPLFEDEEFLNTPVSEAFGNLDENTLDKIIVVVYAEDATEENPASSAFVQKLGQKTIKEMSENLDGIIDETAIGEIVEVNDDSAAVLKYLSDKQVGGLDEAIKAMKIGDAVKIITDEDVAAAALRGEELEASHAILQAIKELTLDELSSDEKVKEETGGVKLSDLMDIVLDEEATEESPASSRVLQYFKINDTTIDTLDQAIKGMKISDAVKITDDSSQVLKYLRDRVNEDGTTGTKLDDLDNAIKEMKISDAVEIVLDEEAEALGKPASSRVLQYFKRNGATLTNLNASVNEMTIGDAVKVTDGSHAVIKAIADLKLNDLGNKETLQGKIDDLKLGDVVTITGSAPMILKSLADVNVGDLSSEMDNLQINEVLEDCSTGVLALIPETTLVKNIGAEVTNTVPNASTYALKMAGVFADDVSASTPSTNLITATSRITKNNATAQEAISAFSSGNLNGVATKAYYLKNGTVSNGSFRTEVGVISGFQAELEITEVADLQADGTYKISDAKLSALTTDANVIFYVDGGISLALEGEYGKIFSVIYDFNDTSDTATLTVADGTSFITDRGGYIVLAAPIVTKGAMVFNKVGEKDNVGVEAISISSLA